MTTIFDSKLTEIIDNYDYNIEKYQGKILTELKQQANNNIKEITNYDTIENLKTNYTSIKEEDITLPDKIPSINGADSLTIGEMIDKASREGKSFRIYKEGNHIQYKLL